MANDDNLYRERRFGSSRQLELPVRVRGDAATAGFENGLLTLTIPKAEEVKPHRIEVKTATGATQTNPVEAYGGARA